MLIRLPRLFESISTRLPSIKNDKRKRRGQSARQTQMDRIEALEPLCLLSALSVEADFQDFFDKVNNDADPTNDEMPQSTPPRMTITQLIDSDGLDDGRVKTGKPTFSGEIIITGRATATAIPNPTGLLATTVTVAEAGNTSNVFLSTTFGAFITATDLSTVGNGAEVPFDFSTLTLSSDLPANETTSLVLILSRGGKEVTSNSFDVTRDTVGPAVSSLTLAPGNVTTRNAINGSVNTVTINFAAPDTSPSTFTVADLQLTKDTVPVTIDAIRLNQTDPSTWTVDVDGLNDDDGTYVLTVTESGISDTTANAGTGTSAVPWTNDLTPPTVSAPALKTEDDTLRTTLPADSGTGSDGVTRQTANITLVGTASSDPMVTVEILDAGTSNVVTMRMVAASMAGSYEAEFGTVAAGNYDLRATADDGVNAPIVSDLGSLLIDVTPPAAPGLTLASASDSRGSHISGDDGITNVAAITLDVTGAATTDAVTVDRSGTTIGPVLPVSGAITSISDTIPSEGTFLYDAFLTDLAGNEGPDSAQDVVVLDQMVPTISNLQIDGADNLFPDSVLTSFVTEETSPSVTLNLGDEQFRTLTNTVRVSVFRVDGSTETELNVMDVDFTPTVGTPDESDLNVTNSQSVTIEATDLGINGPGVKTLRVRATDAAGNVSADSDIAIFTGFVTGDATPNAPGTPVATTFYDLADVLDPDGELPKNQPWQMSFDKTTQTVWINTELGTQTFQFDPATGDIRVYDLLTLDNDNPDVGTNPHGVFFDFDSHLTPRVWVAHRTAGGSNAGKGGSVDGARLSYYDLVANEFITYEFDEDTLGLHVEDLHAVAVDDTGTIWVVGTHSNTVFEISMDKLDPTNRQATVRAHVVPDELADGFPEDFVPHGVDVVVDERTGEQYVWLIAEGGSGRVALLRPGFNSDGSNAWVTWDVGTDALDTRGTFLKIDDGETPGIPDDDRIVATFPVERPVTSGSGNPGGNAGDLSGVLYVLDPGSAALDPDDSTSDPATITTFILPQIPGGPEDLAAVNQPYIDREGTLFYIDRAGGIGRLSADELAASSFDPLTDPARTITTTSMPIADVVLTPDVFDAAPLLRETIAVPIQQFDVTHQTDRSQVAGLDIYEVAGVVNPSNSRQSAGGFGGAFRGTINAASVLYGSIAQSDAVTSTVFAESTRRQVSVVNSDGGGRMVFQTLRNGSLVMTSRPDGALFDEQINLTREVTLQGGIDPESPEFNEIAFDGDPSAIREDDGTVRVFGKNANNNIVEYRFTPTTGVWTTHEHTTPGGVVLAGEPTAFIDGDRGTAAVATSSEGHLILFRPDGSTLDLTALAGDVDASRVYASVGVIDDVSGSRVYMYGSDMSGSVIEYRFNRTGDIMTDFAAEPLVIGSGVRVGSQTARDVNILQSVEAVISGGVRHVFGVDGSSRMVHLTVDGDANVTLAENVTQLIADTTADNTIDINGANVDGDPNNDDGNKDRVSGYFPFQMPYVARVYTELAPIVNADGALSVYGTNGGDLVLLQQVDGDWVGANLSKDIDPTTPDEFTPANFVFGAPDAYIEANGDRHILQINNSGEIVEFTFDSSEGQFSTQNINLARGNSVTDLQEVAAPPPPMAGGVDEAIIDNGDAGYSLFGTSDTFTTDGFDGDFETLGGIGGPQNGSSIASWTFTGLEAGDYRVSATWAPSSNNATNSVFVVITGGSTASQTRVNQQRTPEDFITSGEFWQDLNTSVSVTDGSLTVLLGDDADGRAIADAIRIERLVTMGGSVSPLRAEGGYAAVPVAGFDLEPEDLSPILTQARSIWSATGDLDASQIATLESITPAIVDLSGNTLAGISDSLQLFLDVDAAGYGWFVDATPGGSGEFGQQIARNELHAGATSLAADRIDLLTVVLHEMGHALGYDDLDPADFAHALMSQELGTGVRRLPVSETVTVNVDGSEAAVSLSIDDGDLIVTQSGQQIDRVTLAGVTDVIISASAGADSIIGDFSTPGAVGLTSLVINGGDGDDQFTFSGVQAGFATSFEVNGDGGDDRISSLAGVEYFMGGTGRDVFWQRGSDITISDADFVNATDVTARLDGVELRASARNSVLDASGFSLLPVTVRGSGGADTLRGGSQDDRIYGLGGDDLIEAGAGNDHVRAGGGNDNVSGGDGDDSLQGNSGHDTIDGGAGNDRIIGQAGRDKLRGGTGSDTIRGGAHNDTIVGDGGDDMILGGAGNDLISGGEGNDNLNGSRGSDTVLGDAGRDIIRGGAQRDLLIGGDDTDRILGQGGNADTLVGGNGEDDEGDEDQFDRESEVDNAFAIDTSILDRLNF